MRWLPAGYVAVLTTSSSTADIYLFDAELLHSEVQKNDNRRVYLVKWKKKYICSLINQTNTCFTLWKTETAIGRHFQLSCLPQDMSAYETQPHWQKMLFKTICKMYLGREWVRGEEEGRLWKVPLATKPYSYRIWQDMQPMVKHSLQLSGSSVREVAEKIHACFETAIWQNFMCHNSKLKIG